MELAISLGRWFFGYEAQLQGSPQRAVSESLCPRLGPHDFLATNSVQSSSMSFRDGALWGPSTFAMHMVISGLRAKLEGLLEGRHAYKRVFRLFVAVLESVVIEQTGSDVMVNRQDDVLTAPLSTESKDVKRLSPLFLQRHNDGTSVHQHKLSLGGSELLPAQFSKGDSLVPNRAARARTRSCHSWGASRLKRQPAAFTTCEGRLPTPPAIPVWHASLASTFEDTDGVSRRPATEEPQPWPRVHTAHCS